MEYHLPGVQEFKQGGFSYRDETMDGLEAHLGEGGQLGHHNSAISRCRFRRAGATGGGREGRPRQSRILRATQGSSIAASIRIRPPQRGHSSTTHPRRKFSPSVGTSCNCYVLQDIGTTMSRPGLRRVKRSSPRIAGLSLLINST